MGMNPRLLRPSQSGFDPRRITGLEGWWDASDSTTITLVSSVVSQWNDKSGNGRNFTQATGANRPAVITAGRNGRNVLSFGGSFVTMNQSWTRQLNGGNTWFLVFSFSAGNGTVERPILRMDVNVNALQRGATDAAQVSRRNRIGSFVNNTSSGLFTVDQQADFTTDWQVVSSVVSTTSLGHYQNGVLQGSETAITGTIVSSASTTLRIAEASNAFTIMQAAEILIYSKALSSSERSSVERYLGRKWGITVA
jgi:hypothetical protein